MSKRWIEKVRMFLYYIKKNDLGFWFFEKVFFFVLCYRLLFFYEKLTGSQLYVIFVHFTNGSTLLNPVKKIYCLKFGWGNGSKTGSTIMEMNLFSLFCLESCVLFANLKSAENGKRPSLFVNIILVLVFFSCVWKTKGTILLLN